MKWFFYVKDDDHDCNGLGFFRHPFNPQASVLFESISLIGERTMFTKNRWNLRSAVVALRVGNACFSPLPLGPGMFKECQSCGRDGQTFDWTNCRNRAERLRPTWLAARSSSQVPTPRGLLLSIFHHFWWKYFVINCTRFIASRFMRTDIAIK